MSDQENWNEINRKHLATMIVWIRLQLQRLIPVAKPPSVKQEEPKMLSNCFRSNRSGKKEEKKMLTPPVAASIDEAIARARQKMLELEKNNPPPALSLLASNLGLSEFDRNVLALCAAAALDTRIISLCAKVPENLNKPYPTFALTFTLFDNPDWGTLSPYGPLRHWRLLEINQPGAQPLTSATLAIDERIVNYLKGLNYLDDRLAPLIDPMNIQIPEGRLPPSQQQIVDNIIVNIKFSNSLGQIPVIELLGHDLASKHQVAGIVATALGLNLKTISFRVLPDQIGDFETFTRLWHRESLLMPLALYIEVDGMVDAEKTKLKRFLGRSSGVIFLDIQDAKNEVTRDRLSVEVNKPTSAEQEQIWIKALNGQALDLAQRIAEQFSFDQNEILHLTKIALSQAAGNESELNKNLWQICRVAAREGMEQLAQRIDAKADWEQLVLPPEQKALLQQITDQIAQRNRVYDTWGFREKMNRGLGINALFAGESGTGKTMAAEVIANELQLDLFRIDLSQVVNKYIGETEKNLRKLFDAAEDSGAILFFDEADALFGKRSEVKDSHDRYANIEINYLLQRMESYRGLAILATNMKSALDKAFMRRLRFIVEFPFPGSEERKEIWRKIFPSNTPIDENLDLQRLAKMNLTGGNIHNVALNAAFLAAQQPDGKVTMPLILNAARTEFKKLERPAKESDFRWLDKTEAK
ncbi:ATP-binding protein [Nitrosomonas sp. Nm166]|uniref:ATP-binding protein n=1 Tax=Nitrosomonas sp. Nm166 TaxID=1881054 RepID=UPI0008EDCF0E|nr:AAA family ATPase [Nitrosomonas sp. Nm166]SFE85628.1 AAA+-type ATPase, SpoVK/Ycf46/Vps4 family [Nitrosomonas sp. Nm166]